LQVKPADLRSAHGQQGEAAIMVGVHQFGGGRRGLRQDSQPSKGVNAFEIREHTRRNAWAADAVKAVATGDVVAMKFFLQACRAKTDGGFRAVEAVYADFVRFENNWLPGFQARGD
jgi:hypothetical protein